MKWLSRFIPNGSAFKSRSLARDAETDNRAVASISEAIDLAIKQAQAEERGLKTRLDDVISRAALVGGNGADDFMTRTEGRAKMLERSDKDIKRGQERLAVIGQNLEKFRSLKGILVSHFPASK